MSYREKLPNNHAESLLLLTCQLILNRSKNATQYDLEWMKSDEALLRFLYKVGVR